MTTTLSPRTTQQSQTIRLVSALRFVFAGSFWALLNLAAAAATPDYQIVERGEDYAIYQRITPARDAAGFDRQQTNQFTLLENGLHYFENGAWNISEDVIESAPQGAVARRGPHKAIFSSAEAAFDILTSDGKRLRGGVRAIQVTDTATGRTEVVAVVKNAVAGELLPASTVLYRDAFDGLRADVLYVWKHNFFAQEIVLLEQPQLPSGFNPATARLEWVTEFVNPPGPKIESQSVAVAGDKTLVDDTVIRFGRLALITGRAFPVRGANAVSLGNFGLAEGGTVVLKQWVGSADGNKLLVESVGWTEVQDDLRKLPLAQ